MENKNLIAIKLFRILKTVLLAFLVLTSYAWATSADDAFNPVANQAVYSIVVQADGKILVGGAFTSVGGQTRNFIARLNNDGSLDTGFNPAANSTIVSIALQADGKILVGGFFTSIGGQSRNYIARLNSDGSVDTGFNPGANSDVRAIIVQADGKILVGGYFTSIGGQARNYVARLNSDGSVDTGFNPGADNSVNSIAIQTDNKILVGGRFTTISGQARNRIARLFSDGSVEAGFNPGANDVVYAMAVQADNKILIGGLFTSSGGQTRNYIARLLSNGSLDEGFNPGTNERILSFNIQANGKILVGGWFTSIGGQTQNYIARLNSDGSLDTGFDPGAGNYVYFVVEQADGKILLGGSFSTIGGQARVGIARLFADGSVETVFNPGANGSVDSIAVQADNKILVGGNFATIGGQTRNYIARLNPDGSVDTGFNPGANAAVFSIAIQADNKILVGGSFYLIGGQARDYIARLNFDGSLDTSFNPGSNHFVFSFAVQADGKILVGGYFTTLGGQSRNRIARLNADGSLDTGFNPGANSEVYSIAVQADGKILVSGQFTSIGGQSRNYIARLNADGSVDADFNPGANDSVFPIAVQADNKILVGGNFTLIGGQTRNHIARLNGDGSVDMGFNPDASDGSVSSIVLQADNKILIGGLFCTVGGLTRYRIARLNGNGSVDSGFNPEADNSVHSIAVQPDGKILVGGNFATIGGQSRNYIARLSADQAALQNLSVSSDGATITWIRGQSSPEIHDVVFEHSSDLSTWTSLSSGTRIAGGWQLTGQSLPYDVNRYIRGRGKAPGGVWDASTSLLESIRLYFNTTPTITIISPNGSESWTGGDLHTITWSSVGSIANVNIDLSIDNGSTWNPVAAGTANDGAYSWTVPAVSSTVCLVRIYDAADGIPLDGSDSVFTIVAPAETISMPNWPTGPTAGLNNTSYSFSTGGSTSSLGHSVQYMFDWNDGTDSGWLAVGTTQASHSWTTNGTYEVRAMARCATHTNLESLWSESHSILVSDTGSAGYYNSPSNRLIITEVNWAPASGGGNWISEVQITDMTGGSTVQVYYNSGTTRNGPFTLWTNSGVDGHNVKFANILQTIDGLDSGPFVYYGTSGALELITQDATHLIQASVRTYNGNYTRTFPALTDCETNTTKAYDPRQLMIPNITNNATYRPSVVLFNPSADSISVLIHILGSDGGQIGPTITRTLAGYEMNVITTEVRAYTYDNAYIVIGGDSGNGRVMASGQTANNYTNDPAAHLAVQFGEGYPNSPSQTKYLTEVNWAPASGGGDWVSEVQITDITGGSTVQVYYNSGTTRHGPFTLWANPGAYYTCTKFTNVLSTIDGLDSSGFVYYGTSGSLEFTTQDVSHTIQAAVRTYNGNFSRTFPVLSDNESNTVALGRFMIIPNITNNATYRPSVVLFNPTSESVTAELMIVGSDGIPIGSTITRTVAGYEMNVITTEVRANTYDSACVRVAVTSGSGRLLVSGQTANNYTNDPAAHIAVQGQ